MDAAELTDGRDRKHAERDEHRHRIRTYSDSHYRLPETEYADACEIVDWDDEFEEQP
jgi:hypothetical protein